MGQGPGLSRSPRQYSDILGEVSSPGGGSAQEVPPAAAGGGGSHFPRRGKGPQRQWGGGSHFPRRGKCPPPQQQLRAGEVRGKALIPSDDGGRGKCPQLYRYCSAGRGKYGGRLLFPQMMGGQAGWKCPRKHNSIFQTSYSYSTSTRTAEALQNMNIDEGSRQKKPCDEDAYRLSLLVFLQI